MTKSFIPFIFFLLLGFAGCSDGGRQTADLVLINGQIATIEDSAPSAEAVVIENDTILYVGSTEEAKKFIGDSTITIDLNSKFVMPGFIDSHAHFMSLGNSKMILDLNGAKNWNEIVYLVAEAVQKARPGEWIVGRGWHQEKWDPAPFPHVEGYPIHSSLSSASPNNPVMLTHASGHAVFANKKAMASAGIDTISQDPSGGKIVRDSLGNAIGVFEEEAEGLIQKAYNEYMNRRTPERQLTEKKKAIEIASRECLSKGITSVHDAGSSFDNIDLFKTLADSNKLKTRLYVMIREDKQELEQKLDRYKIIGYGNNFLTVRAIKEYIDGALGSRGAWMLDEYVDLPGHTGQNVTSLNYLDGVAELAINHDFQLCTHAIGDKGVRETLNYYERAMNNSPDKKDIRWRVEHAQHISDRDIARFSKLGVIAAMQGVHCTSDAVFVRKRLGSYRAQNNSYVWRKLMETGAVICNGTDAPVEDVDPLKSFYSSVTRKTESGIAFYPEQAMTRLEALKSYTINGAYAAFEENLKGSIKTGKLADLVVLSNNLLECPEEEIPNTKVIYTIVSGKILYENALLLK